MAVVDVQQFKLFLLLVLTKLVNSIPHNVCFEKFDERDCKGPPKQVFYYYKEGSRCETKIWRGCPTRNIFEDEVICSHYCIGKMIRETNKTETESSFCSSELNHKYCGINAQKVYTHKNGSCVLDEWFGCKTLNKFDSKQSCIDTCIGSENDWIYHVQTLKDQDVEQINAILDEIVPEADVSSNQVPLVKPEPLKDSSSTESKDLMPEATSKEDKEPSPDSSLKDGNEPSSGSSPKEDKEHSPDSSPKEDNEPSPGSSPKEDKEPLPDPSPKEDKEPIPDSFPKEDKEPIPDSSPKEDKEPIPDSSPKEDKEPTPDPPPAAIQQLMNEADTGSVEEVINKLK